MAHPLPPRGCEPPCSVVLEGGGGVAELAGEGVAEAGFCRCCQRTGGASILRCDGRAEGFVVDGLADRIARGVGACQAANGAEGVGLGVADGGAVGVGLGAELRAPGVGAEKLARRGVDLGQDLRVAGRVLAVDQVAGVAEGGAVARDGATDEVAILVVFVIDGVAVGGEDLGQALAVPGVGLGSVRVGFRLQAAVVEPGVFFEDVVVVLDVAQALVGVAVGLVVDVGLGVGGEGVGFGQAVGVGVVGVAGVAGPGGGGDFGVGGFAAALDGEAAEGVVFVAPDDDFRRAGLDDGDAVAVGAEFVVQVEQDFAALGIRPAFARLRRGKMRDAFDAAEGVVLIALGGAVGLRDDGVFQPGDVVRGGPGIALGGLDPREATETTTLLSMVSPESWCPQNLRIY